MTKRKTVKKTVKKRVSKKKGGEGSQLRKLRQTLQDQLDYNKEIEKNILKDEEEELKNQKKRTIKNKRWWRFY